MSAVPPCFLTLSPLTQTTREHLRRMALLYSPLTLSAFRFQSYLRYCLPGISLSHEVPSLCGVRYLLLFVTTFFSVPLPVFETVSADTTIVGFFSFVKVFVDTRIKSSEQSGIKGAKCFLPQHLLSNIVNASQFQTVRKLLFYLVLPVCRILHVS